MEQSVSRSSLREVRGATLGEGGALSPQISQSRRARKIPAKVFSQAREANGVGGDREQLHAIAGMRKGRPRLSVHAQAATTKWSRWSRT